MSKQYYEKVFSVQRMEKYFKKYPKNNDKAIIHYHLNIELSESFYSSLSMFEVAYRNSLNRELTKTFGDDWYLKIESTPGLRNLINNIKTAKKQITNRNENLTPNKVVAVLTLGFWVRLLNAEYELILWKTLRKAFPFLEKNRRQRKNVSAPINKIRNFRNRVFHHEPISWNIDKLEDMHNTIYEVMHWLDTDLPKIAKKYDSVYETINNAKKELAT